MKKTFSLILCLSMIISMFAFSVNAESVSENLSVTITADKESYGIFSDAEITVTVKNIGSTIVGDIHSGAESGEYKLITGTQSTATIPFLEPGQEASYSFLVSLRSDVDGLSFFQWIILLIKNFITSTSTFPIAGINPDYTVRTTAVVKHAGIKAGVSAWAYYSDTYTVDETVTKEDIISMYNNGADKAEQDEKYFASVTSDFVSAKAGNEETQNIFNTVEPIIQKSLAFFSTGSDKIPGTRPLKAENVKEAYAYTNSRGNIIYKIIAADQDGNDALSDKIPVDGIRIGINNLGFDIVSGFDTLTITNTDSTVLFTYNQSTGYITSGKWYTLYNISIGDMILSYKGIEMPLQDVSLTYSCTTSF